MTDLATPHAAATKDTATKNTATADTAPRWRVADIEALPGRLPTLYRRLTE